jgi:hypothetical protein
MQILVGKAAEEASAALAEGDRLMAALTHHLQTRGASREAALAKAPGLQVIAAPPSRRSRTDKLSPRQARHRERCGAIAGLFDDAKSTLAGKHPFTDAQLATLRDRGGWLADRLKPSGAVRDPRGRSAAALTKDRFGKLLEDDYADLLKATVAIWGVDEYCAHVPALHSRERAAPAKKPPPGGTGSRADLPR